MIDKTDMEIRAIKDARRFFAEALTELGLMDAFYHRGAAEIDRLIEATVTGYIESMQRQAATIPVGPSPSRRQGRRSFAPWARRRSAPSGKP